MKRLFIYRMLTVLVVAATLFAACTKGTSDTKLTQAISTSQFSNVTSATATVVGFVVAAGDGFSEKGVCYNTATGPTVSNTKVAYTAAATSATYTVNLTGLAYATIYYARAYATGLEGTVYGEEVTFTTLPVVPTLTTAAITAVTGNSAAGGGNVTVLKLPSRLWWICLLLLLRMLHQLRKLLPSLVVQSRMMEAEPFQPRVLPGEQLQIQPLPGPKLMVEQD